MQRHDSPSLALAQTSPEVVPKYSPRRSSRSSAHIAWRSTVNQPCCVGSPRSRRCQDLPALRVHVYGGPAADRRARPDGRAVHREHPGLVGIGRMQHDGEADVTDLPRHRIADAGPALTRPVEAIDAAVVLLVEAVGLQRVHRDAVRIVAVRRVDVRHEVRGATGVQGPPVCACRRWTRRRRRSKCRRTGACASRGSISTECSSGPIGVPVPVDQTGSIG